MSADDAVTATDASTIRTLPEGSDEPGGGGRPARPAVLLAVAVAVAGFGAQAAMWALGRWPGDVSGWPDYRAATLGDLMMVPLLTGTLLAAVRALPAPSARSRLPVVLGVTGLLLGSLTQAGWLLDDSPQLNWAMARPHHFTYAGWYHAGFLVAATALIGWLGGSLLPRLRTADRLPFARLLAFSATGFAALLSADLLFPAGPDRHHIAPGGAVSVAATLAVTALSLLALRPRGAARDLGAHRRRCAAGCALALVVAAAAVPWASTPVLGWSVAVAALAATVPRRNGRCVKTASH